MSKNLLKLTGDVKQRKQRSQNNRTSKNKRCETKKKFQCSKHQGKPQIQRWTATGIQNVVKVIMFFTSMVLHLSTLTIGKADFLLRLHGKDDISGSDVKQAGKS